MIVYLCLFIFYAIQLALYRKGLKAGTIHDSDMNGNYLIAIDVLLLVQAIVALGCGWIFRSVFQSISVVFNAVLFGLTFGWLILAAPNAAEHHVYFGFNSAVVLFLIIIDVSIMFYVRPEVIAVASGAKKSNRKSLNPAHISTGASNPKLSTTDQLRGAVSSFLPSYGKIRHRFLQSEDDTAQQNGPMAEKADEEMGVADKEAFSSVFGGEGGASRRNSAQQALVSSSNSPFHDESSPDEEAEVILGGYKVDTADKAICEGFRINMGSLPSFDGNQTPRNLTWDDFAKIQHIVDSSSCHIYTALWKNQPVVLKLIKAERVSSAVAVAEFDAEEGTSPQPAAVSIASLISRCMLRLRCVEPRAPPEHRPLSRLRQSAAQVPRARAAVGRLAVACAGPPRRQPQSNVGEALHVPRDAGLRAVPRSRAEVPAPRLVAGRPHHPPVRLPPARLSPPPRSRRLIASSVHSDLKPDNIGFAADGRVKLFDFGLCASVRAQREKTEQYRLTGNTGTLRYMAPEVVLGRSYHQSVDVYSFGILLWQVASGKVPFRDMGKKTYFDRVVVGGQRPRIDARWPLTFAHLLRQCWHEDKHARPSFVTIVQELETLVRQEEAQVLAQHNQLHRRVARSCLWCLQRFRPLFLLLILAVFIASLWIVVGEDDTVLGAVLGALSTFGIYAILMSYLSVWPASAGAREDILEKIETQRKMRVLASSARFVQAPDASTGIAMVPLGGGSTGSLRRGSGAASPSPSVSRRTPPPPSGGAAVDVVLPPPPPLSPTAPMVV